jgi:hypothetical protein
MLSFRINRNVIRHDVLMLFFCSWFFHGSICAQHFSDVTTSQGINVSIDPIATGNSVSFYDWNYDGWDDLTFCQINQPPQFFQNTGEEFVEVAPFVESEGICRQVSWVDFDNDGDADLFLCFEDQPMELHENDGDFGFTNITCQAGFPETFVRNYSFCWGDYNIDGFLDVYVSVYWDPTYDEDYETENHLFKNNGDGTFSDVTIESNASDGHTFTLAPIWWDYNMDGIPDLYVVNDKWTPNTLFKNDGAGNFDDVSESSGTNIVVDGMSATPGDFNHDGAQDMYVTSTLSGNVLLENNGGGSYSDATFDAGVGTYEDCWGAAWMDPDLDTDLDLYVTTQGGWANGNYLGEQNYFFENTGVGVFTPMHNNVGLAADDAHTHCVAVGDYNRDGLPDFALSNIEPFLCQLWKNTTETDNHFIGISLQGTVSNREAVGSWIHVYAGGELWSQYTYSSENYLSQNSMRKIFGLGELEVVDSVVVNWPNGLQQNFGALAVGTYHHLIEGYVETPPVLYNDDLILCEGESLILTTEEYPSYLWSTGDTTQSILVTEPGNYSVIVQNELGFLQPSEEVQVIIPEEFEWQITSVEVSCAGGDDGAFLFDSSGDQGPAQNFQWLDDSELQIGMDSSISSLSSGTYTFIFEDQFACIWGGEYTLTEPASIEADLESSNATCYGFDDGSAEAFPSGGTGDLVVDWNGEDPLLLAAGDYTFTVTDEAGCSLNQDFTIEEPDEIIVTAILENVSCHGASDGSIMTELFGGTGPLQIEWLDLNPDSLVGGDYTVIISDSIGCTSEFSFEIQEPDPLEVTITTTDIPEGWLATADVSGGTPPYLWNWNNGGDEQSSEYPDEGLVSVMVTDTNGCQIEAEITVTNLIRLEPQEMGLFPNPTSGSLSLQPHRGVNFSSFSIYSEEGQLMLSSPLSWHQSQTIDVSGLSAGYYLIAFKSASGTVTYTFMKQ